MQYIDLNSDVGESYGSWSMGDDTAIFQSVSSANVACGFHAGDPRTIAHTCREAAKAGITIGAHVGYHDLAGFGRRFIEVPGNELADDLLYQLGAMDAMARAAGSEVKYVKPHGALYNAIVHHEEHAQAVIDAIRAFGRDLPVLLLPGSIALDKAERSGLRAVSEAFADRSYNPDGTLVSRTDPAAVLHDPQRITQNMIRLASEGTIRAIDGTIIRTSAESICVHGDTAGAVAVAAAVRAGLESSGIDIKSFA
ncbi:LamB/YcsF family protein [Glutamicibacter creatinolyticus]|uniref:5-oxoprolinase subunit A n=1 Tax=Glutamicibacter creatinolyticus TaxID=162496 RepID=A0A5B7WQW0_9MICC|nr:MULTISPECIES: 5-oxoprolinase subunit PxpA [Glutamicibacter]QCY46297.1 5-oxoprolinase subunit A [Glutamicibacter creatinolyticus]TLK56768.1 LamB/YcsF family protein [Glutamicibacter sp. V16R2B1]